VRMDLKDPGLGEKIMTVMASRATRCCPRSSPPARVYGVVHRAARSTACRSGQSSGDQQAGDVRPDRASRQAEAKNTYVHGQSCSSTPGTERSSPRTG
jgi:hypothetical protein